MVATGFVDWRVPGFDQFHVDFPSSIGQVGPVLAKAYTKEEPASI